jgi:hypothetical protein
VDEMIAPISMPSSVGRSNSHEAANPQITHVPSVPTIASDSEDRRTGLISSKPAVRPPSNRISASATTPIVRASS